MYESHITVRGISPELFEAQCRILRVKSILIENDTGSGISQMMTGKFHHTQSQRKALSEMFSIGRAFGTNVVRRKLERIGEKITPITDYLYREIHLKYAVEPARLESFRELVTSRGGHTSQNRRKLDAGGGKQFEFATFRDLGQAQVIEMACVNEGYRLVGKISEIVCYDDNPGIDRYWHECMDCSLKWEKAA